MPKFGRNHTSTTMKNLLLLVILLLISNTSVFSQNWTTEEKAVLTQYNLSENDHRGLEFSSDSDSELSFNNLNDALTYFLENKTVTDLTHIYVSTYPETQQLEGATIGIKEIVQHYILTTSLN